MRYSSADPAVGPARHRPDDIGCRKPRRHRQHRALRFLPEQQIDGRHPLRPPKHYILAPRWVDHRERRRRFTLRRLDLQRCLELRQSPRWLADVPLLALLACFRPAATLWSSLAIRRHRHRQFPWYRCRPWALWPFLTCERPRLRCVAHASDGGYVWARRRLELVHLGLDISRLRRARL